MEFLTDLFTPTFLLQVGSAILIMIIGWRLASFCRTWIQRVLVRSKLTDSLTTLFGVLTYNIVLVLSIILALSVLGVPLTSSIAAVGIILIILGIALRESIGNFAATILFLLFQPFKVGDLVETSGVLGNVKEIEMFYTTIVNFQNKVVTIPNGKIQDSNIINYSRLGILRADISLSVSYGENLPEVKRVLEQMLAADERVLKNPSATVVVLDFEDNGIKMGVRPFVMVADYWDLQFDLRERILHLFNENNITIPFPQRDVHLMQKAL